MSASPTPLEIAALILAGALAGFANVLAGGGSLLTLPVLLFLGLPSSVANATNRISLIVQNISATTTFARKRMWPRALAIKLFLCALPGAILGARLALELDETLFRRILAGVILLSLAPLMRSSKAASGARGDGIPHPVWLGLSFALMGIYAGFLQAGLGFLLIAALTQLGGLDLVRTNAVKVSVVLGLQLAALVVFQRAGAVDWVRGACLAAGSASGAWLAAHLQMERGAPWARRILMVLVLLVVIRLLWPTT